MSRASRVVSSWRSGVRGLGALPRPPVRAARSPWHACVTMGVHASHGQGEVTARGIPELARRWMATESNASLNADPLKWSVEDVVQWAETVVDREDAAKLREQKVKGSALLDMTEEKLERCGIPVGPATDLVKAIKGLKGGNGEVDSVKEFSSFYELIEWLKASKRFPLRDYTQPPEPKQLPSFSRQASYQPIPRDEALELALSHLMEREDSQADKRQGNPLVATQAAPGTGKSYFLDLVKGLRPDDPVVRKVPGADEMVKSWIPIPISYNQFSHVEKYDLPLKMSIDEGLAVRMLYSFIVDYSRDEGNSFDPFLRCVIPTVRRICRLINPVKPLCDFILATLKPHGKTSIFLLVDELLKIGDGVFEFLHAIGGLQDDYSIRFRSIVTSLGVDLFNDERMTRSGRRVLFVPLPLFQQADVLIALKAFIAKIPEEEEQKRFRFHVLVSDCSGHARTLEQLCRIWDGDMTYESITRKILDAVVDPQRPRVIAALRADAVDLKESIAPRGAFEDDIKSGLFINSVPSVRQETLVPQLSVLQLRKYVLQHRGEGDFPKLDNLVRVPEMATDSILGRAFEEFCRHWELLIAEYPHENAHTVLGHYLRSPLPYEWDSNDVAFKKTCKRMVGVKGQTTNVASTDYQPGVLYYSLASNNPGFDYFYMEETEKGTIVIFVECKYSAPSSVTSLSKDQVLAKLRHIQNALAFKDDGKAKERKFAHVYAFFAVLRRVSGDVEDTLIQHEGIVGIVLHRERLKKLFGPTLFARPEFYGDYTQKGASGVGTLA